MNTQNAIIVFVQGKLSDGLLPMAMTGGEYDSGETLRSLFSSKLFFLSGYFSTGTEMKLGHHSI